ncbi:MAG TPA: DUF3846 domain-containing protein [Solirubrobacteraceae bacterium]
MKVLVIPVAGPLEEVVLVPGDRFDGGTLGQLQELVDGMIEAVPLPGFISQADAATSYVNEEGKLLGLAPNMRATDFFVPGIGLHFGDYIAGPLVLAGFDPHTGEHAELPAPVAARARLIEREAS